MDGWRNGKQATSVMWLDYCKLSAIWPISVVPRSGTPFPELDPTASVGVVMLSCFSQCIRAKTAITTFPIQAFRQAICTIPDNLSPLPIWAIRERVSHLQIMCFFPPVEDAQQLCAIYVIPLLTQGESEQQNKLANSSPLQSSTCQGLCFPSAAR